MLVVSFVVASFASSSPSLAQNYQQQQPKALSYPAYERYQGDFAEPTDMVPAQNNYNQAPPQNYQYQQMPRQTYPTYQQQAPVNSYQPNPQMYKRAPRMHYHDTGHLNNNLQSMFSNNPVSRQPRHFQTNQTARPLFNRNTMKQNMLKAIFGGSPGASRGGGGYGAGRDPSATGRASSNRSYALSQASAAEACADRARYGHKDSRRSAAYEARSHANNARAAAEKAQAAANQGGDEAKGYAADAWAASNRAESAASRAESAANVW